MKGKSSIGEAAGLQEVGQNLGDASCKCSGTQEEFANIFTVSTNTRAQWERGDLKASGDNRRTIRNVQAVTKNQRVLDVIQNIKNMDDGMAAIADNLQAMRLGDLSSAASDANFPPSLTPLGLVSLFRNRRSVSRGIGGQLGPEYAAAESAPSLSGGRNPAPAFIVVTYLNIGATGSRTMFVKLSKSH